MSARLTLAVAAGLALTLAACDTVKQVFDRGDDGDGGGGSAAASQTGEGETDAGSTGTDPTPEHGLRDVEFPVIAESASRSVFGRDMSETFASATVPVLAPASMTEDQAARFAESYRVTPDGYFARIPGADFDVIVNATRAFAVAPAEAGARPREASTYTIGESETGLGVTLSRFGADYSIDFACRGEGDEGGADCVTEDAAAAFVEQLIPVGGGGQ